MHINILLPKKVAFTFHKTMTKGERSTLKDDANVSDKTFYVNIGNSSEKTHMWR